MLEVIVKPLSQISQLYHNHSIFGFLCYQILDIYGESKLESILSEIEQNKHSLKISSLMPNQAVFLPTLDIGYDNDLVRDPLIVKKLKKVKFIDIEALQQLLKHPPYGDYLMQQIKNNHWVIQKDLLTSLKDNPYQFELDINIRTNMQNFLEDTEIFNVKSYAFHPQTQFHFYIESSIEEINSILKQLKFIQLGKIKNNGLNQFSVESIKEVTFMNSNHGVLISKYKPIDLAEFNLESSKVKIEMMQLGIESRMLIQNETLDKDMISVIAEGSYLFDAKMSLGNLIKKEKMSSMTNKTIYFHGIGMLFPIEVL
jgi:CRISPR type III-A-associated RAMP protein Csm4